MPNLDLLINPKTGEDYISVPPQIAAKFLGVALTFVYSGLQQGTLPIGAAARSEKGIWCYNIPCQRLKNYAAGVVVTLLARLNAVSEK